jgi:hypothetical protein
MSTFLFYTLKMVLHTRFNLEKETNSPYVKCHRFFSGMQYGAAAEYCVFYRHFGSPEMWVI